MSQAKIIRQPWLDIVRAFAILCVVLCHCVEGVYSFDPASVRDLGTWHGSFAVSMYTLGRVGGVPLFLMLSGYLLLDREYDGSGCVTFWKKNWLRLLICTQVWILLYELFLLAYQDQPIPIGYLVRALLFLEPSSMYHMWYMPMLLGIYLLVPLAATALVKIPVKVLWFPLVLLLAYGFGVPGYTMLATVFGKTVPVSQFSLGFSGGVYGIYFVSGYIIKKGLFSKIKTWILWAAGLLSFAAMVVLQWHAYGKGMAAGVWYDFPMVYVCAVSLFELARRYQSKLSYNPFCELLSRYSFAIFLLHIVVRTVMLPWINGLALWRPIKMCLAWDAFTLISLLVAVLLVRIPKVGKYLLYVKK